MQKVLLASLLLIALNLQGCASTFDTFMTGAAVGGLLVGCTRYCY